MSTCIEGQTDFQHVLRAFALMWLDLANGSVRSSWLLLIFIVWGGTCLLKTVQSNRIAVERKKVISKGRPVVRAVLN